jgi:hypothetical protein
MTPVAWAWGGRRKLMPNTLLDCLLVAFVAAAIYGFVRALAWAWGGLR